MTKAVMGARPESGAVGQNREPGPRSAGCLRAAEMSRNGSSITVHVPLAFRRRGGRKLVISPEGAPAWAPPRPRVDNTMVKALARAHRWKRMLETGHYASV